MEEKKNRSRIDELEARLKKELRGTEMSAREMEQVLHLANITERSETIKKIEEIKDNRARVERLVEDGYEVVEAPLPFLMTVVKEINS